MYIFIYIYVYIYIYIYISDPLTGIPTAVNAVPIVEIPLITPTEFTPIDAVVICCKHFYIFLVFHDICSKDPYCLDDIC